MDSVHALAFALLVSVVREDVASINQTLHAMRQAEATEQVLTTITGMFCAALVGANGEENALMQLGAWLEDRREVFG